MISSIRIPDIKEKLKIYNLFFLIFLLLSLKMNLFAQDDYLGNKIVSDSLGNSYVTGDFRNPSLSFGNFNLSNYGGSDIFLAKYDSNGKIVWAKNIGGSGDEKILSIHVDYNGNISLSATSSSSIINLGNEQLKSDESGIIFNSELNSNGNVISTKIENAINRVSSQGILKSNNSLRKVSGIDTTLVLLSPNAGDHWQVGTKGVIEWSSENISNVIIELSADNGASWQKIYTSNLFDVNKYVMIVPDTPSDSCLIRISNFDNPVIADTSRLFTIFGELNWKIKQNNYNSVLRNIYSFDPTTSWAVGFNGLIKTTDEGESWSPKLTGYGLFDIFFLNKNTGWTVGLNGTIFKTTNGGDDWVKLDNNFNYHFEKVYFADENNGYMIGKNYFLKTTDGGKSWNAQQPTDHILQTMFFVNKDTGWIAGNEGVILKTTDAGSTWIYLQMNGTDYGTLTSLYFLDNNTGWASGSGLDINGGVILKTVNGGESWVLQHNGYSRFIYSVYFSSLNSGWAVGDEGVIFNTADGGLNWELQGSGTFSDLYSINVKSFLNGWSVGDDGLILKYTKDTNSSLSPLPVEFTSFEVNSNGNSIELNWSTATEVNNKGFEIERQITNDLTTNDGNSQSSLVDGHWVKIGFVIGKGTTTISSKYFFTDNLKDISFNGDVNYRLKQIDYDGTFKYSQEVAVHLNTIPAEYSLMQNYPNPFNPATTIKYSVKENTQVILKVFDILGREVATLSNEEKSAGTYTINFDAASAGLSSGTYFYTIKAGDFVQTKKMLLMK